MRPAARSVARPPDPDPRGGLPAGRIRLALTLSRGTAEAARARGVDLSRVAEQAIADASRAARARHPTAGR